jgi:hypothetical protein
MSKPPDDDDGEEDEDDLQDLLDDDPDEPPAPLPDDLNEALYGDDLPAEFEPDRPYDKQ